MFIVLTIEMLPSTNRFHYLGGSLNFQAEMDTRRT
jgi:hypothetical protein